MTVHHLFLSSTRCSKIYRIFVIPCLMNTAYATNHRNAPNKKFSLLDKIEQRTGEMVTKGPENEIVTGLLFELSDLHDAYST